MKLLTIAIPSYNSQDYLRHAVDSLLPGGDEVEILIVNDGSKDATAQIADEYERQYPGIVRAIHKENGGHGDAVMCGLAHATGLYFKVVDSDDWVDEEAYPKVLAALRAHAAEEAQLDMLVSNYIYDKVGVKHKFVMRYANALRQNTPLTWDEVGRFQVGQYMLMHSVIYRTQLLRACGLNLPKHTFYVDELYVYVPLQHVKKLMYLDVNLYHYFIGREDQSVQEQVMIRRIDQQLLVNRLMLERVDVLSMEPRRKRQYMLSYLEIITTVSSILLIKSGTPENLAKKDALWREMKEKYPQVYRKLRRKPLGIALNFKTPIGHKVAVLGYRLSRKIFGFN